MKDEQEANTSGTMVPLFLEKGLPEKRDRSNLPGKRSATLRIQSVS
jgi:hypothetical protein